MSRRSLWFTLLVFIILLFTGCSSKASLEVTSNTKKPASVKKVLYEHQPITVGSEPGVGMSSVPHSVHPKGVALVVHGLNLKPGSMGDILKSLNGAGLETVAVTLTGHDVEGRNADQRMRRFKDVSYELWLAEVDAGYAVAAARAKALGVPVFLVGYSIGGLLGCDLMLSRNDVIYDRMVLFAPAMAIRPSSYFLSLLSPFPELVIPSVSPESHRANDGTPIAAYNALYRSIEHASDIMDQKINVPSLVFIDPSDELVSYTGLVELIEANQLSHWSVEAIEKGEDAEGSYNHLIIDRGSLGAKTWQYVERKMIRYLTHPGLGRAHKSGG